VGEPEVHRIATFRIVEKLGEGGMGIVYKAFDEKLQRTVAIKVLPSSFADSDDRKRRFLREARSAAAVTHANIATLYEVGEDEGRVFLVMELVEGKTLQRILKEGALTIAEAMRIAKGIVRGLARAHERGIVHRDMKPENVMLDADGEVKILDFGLAKLREQTDETAPSKSILERDETEAQATQEGRVLGTPGYMSPEQAKGKIVDHRTDLFSFGVVLYEMLTGQKAFKGETSLDVMIAVSRDQPVPPSRINAAVTPEIQRVVDRCLAKTPAERYATARELIAAIEEIVSSTASGPGAITTSSPQGSPVRRSRKPLIVAAVVGVLAIGAGAIALRGKDADTAKGSTPPPVVASASSAAPVPTAITDLPPPKTSVPAAASEYAAGMQSYRDGSVAMGNAHVQRATELDPSFAAAHLMLAAVNVGLLDDLRKHLAVASDHRADLSPRDLALLEVLQTDLARDTPDFEAKWQRWRKLVDRFPGDAGIVVLAAMQGLGTSHESEAFALLDRATSLDPRFTWPLMYRAIALVDDGRYDDALETVDRCLAITPTAASCLRRRAEVEARRGECAKVMNDARAMVAIEPSGSSAYDWLATALIATNAPVESIEQALRTSRELMAEPTMKALYDSTAPMARPWFEGDLGALERFFPQLDKMIAAASSDYAVSELTTMEAIVYEQVGEPDRAAAVYSAYLKRLPALVEDEASGARPEALWSLLRAKRLSPAEFHAKREEWVKLTMENMSPRDTGSAWFRYYAAYVKTPEEAREALDALPRFTPMRPYDGLVVNDVAMGHALRVAGRTDEAEPHLRRAANACSGYPFEVYWHLRAESELGETLEQKGDVAGACAAYGNVLDHWGHAKPRSVLVDEVRAHAAKLACKPAP
jgi:serine/threonine-protein kinase